VRLISPQSCEQVAVIFCWNVMGYALVPCFLINTASQVKLFLKAVEKLASLTI